LLSTRGDAIAALLNRGPLFAAHPEALPALWLLSFTETGILSDYHELHTILRKRF
jgi:hypothetical protein